MNNISNPTSDSPVEPQQLWNELSAKGIVEGEMPSSNAIGTAWYIRAILGIAGWFAAFFLLGAFASVYVLFFNSADKGVLLTIALMINAVVIVLYRLVKNNDFVHQFALVFSLCAQLIFAFGLYEVLHSLKHEFFLLLFMYQLILAILTPNFLNRLLTSWFAFLALNISASYSGYFDLMIATSTIAFTLIWAYDDRWGKLKSIWEPLGYSLALALLMFNGQFFFVEDLSWWIETESNLWFDQYGYLVSSLIDALVVIVLLLRLAKEYQLTFRSATGGLVFLAGLAMLVMGYYILGVSAGFILLLIGFMKQRKLLLIFGILTLLSFVSWFYYSLTLTLLTKSIILMGGGIVFVIANFLIARLNDNRALSLSWTNNAFQFSKKNQLALGMLLVILVLVNVNIYEKEKILNQGDVVLLKLAPADPRSIMQGDYMRLRFSVAEKIRLALDQKGSDKVENTGFFVVDIDDNHLATFAAIYQGQRLSRNQRLMPYKNSGYRIKMVTDAYYFQEGQAEIFEAAQYGEFRVSRSGTALLNNLRGEKFEILGKSPP